MKGKAFIIMGCMALSAVLFNAGAAKGADGVTPYFQAKLWYGYDKIDKNFTYSPNSSQVIVNTVGKTDTDTIMDLPMTGSARMGFNAELGKVKGNAELGFTKTAVALRHLYASYDLGFAEILFGRTFTPYTNTSNSNVADDEGGNWDVGTYDARQPQVKLTFAKVFYIDFISPYAPGSSNPGYLVSSAYIDQTLPKMAAGVSLPAGPATVSLHFVYQQYTIAKEASTSGTAFNLDGTKVKGMMVPFSVKAKLDPIALNVNAYWGKNAGILGLMSFCDVTPNVSASGTSLKDNTSMGAKLDLTLDAGIGKLNGGFAYEKSKDDVSGAKDDVTMSYYVNFMYNLQKNLYIAPAWWRVDMKKSGTGAKQGTFDKFGLKFDATF